MVKCFCFEFQQSRYLFISCAQDTETPITSGRSPPKEKKAQDIFLRLLYTHTTHQPPKAKSDPRNFHFLPLWHLIGVMKKHNLKNIVFLFFLHSIQCYSVKVVTLMQLNTFCAAHVTHMSVENATSLNSMQVTQHRQFIPYNAT